MTETASRPKEVNESMSPSSSKAASVGGLLHFGHVGEMGQSVLSAVIALVAVYFLAEISPMGRRSVASDKRQS
jgi:hypothetical protein